MSAAVLIGFFLIDAIVFAGVVLREESRSRAEADIERLSVATLPERREAVLPIDWHETWPPRQTPSDLPARVGLVVGEDRPGRHEVGVAPGTDLQRARWNTPTGQFWVIVEELGDLEQPCAHCATPEEGEPAHAGCPGCCCPCTLAEVANV